MRADRAHLPVAWRRRLKDELGRHEPEVGEIELGARERLIVGSCPDGSFRVASPGATLSSLASMLPLLLMFVVLYFVMIRPQMKRQKEARAMLDALQKGDEVATAGGLLGRITVLGDQFLTIEVANGVEIKVQRSAVVQVLPKGTVK